MRSLASLVRVSRSRPRLVVALGFALLAPGAIGVLPAWQAEPRRWLAGDPHVHSEWSTGDEGATGTSASSRGADAIYAIQANATTARAHGLAWMVGTDHGGADHARVSRDEAYPALQRSRAAVPDVLQFLGLELNMPGMDHHTLIVPFGADERDLLYEIEHRFDAKEAWPQPAARVTADARHALLAFVSSLPRRPLIFANHPSRSARGLGSYGLDDPMELRDSASRAPDVYRGMEGAPGHQAAGLAPDGTPRRKRNGKPTGFRGDYARSDAHTLGGFDQMTAVVGGAWDALLAQGTHFWIVAGSDSHVHHTEGSREGNDFWPGEFHKTYVLADGTPDDVLDGMRRGRMFVVAGDLISQLSVNVREGRSMADIGGTLSARHGEPVQVTIRFRDPAGANHGGRTPRVQRVDVIVGDLTEPGAPLERQPTARVIARLTDRQWTCQGETCETTVALPPSTRSQFVRVRGTSTTDDEPAMDTAGENPWDDLWFYANPVFIDRGSIAPPVAAATAIRVPANAHP